MASSTSTLPSLGGLGTPGWESAPGKKQQTETPSSAASTMPRMFQPMVTPVNGGMNGGTSSSFNFSSSSSASNTMSSNPLLKTGTSPGGGVSFSNNPVSSPGFFRMSSPNASTPGMGGSGGGTNISNGFTFSQTGTGGTTATSSSTTKTNSLNPLLRGGSTNSKGGVGLTGKSSVSMSAFGSAAAPSLSSVLQDNGGEFGIRQRRVDGVGKVTKNTSLMKIEKNKNLNNMPPPPKTSLMSMSSTFGQGTPIIAAAPHNGTESKYKEKDDSSCKQNISSSNPTIQPYDKIKTSKSSSSLPLHYANWVVVYGFASSSPTQYNTILSRFNSYGTILSRFPATCSSSTDTNWVCLEYKTRLEAQKALCQHGSFLDASDLVASSGRSSEVVIVGVMRMDNVLAQKLGLNSQLGLTKIGKPSVTADSRITTHSKVSSKMDVDQEEKSIVSTTHQPRAFLKEDDVLILEDLNENEIVGQMNGIGSIRHDVLGARARDGSVCDKVLTWVFQW